MINPVVLKFGGLELHAFTASLLLVSAIGVALMLWTAYSLHQPLIRWLDGALGAVIGGLIGARAFHVALEWTYFSTHTDQITLLSGGGLDWHGAVFGGLLGGTLIAVVRGVPFRPFTDSLAVVLPLGAVATWSACGMSACAYGREVRTLADFPGWLVIELPDVYGAIAPRLNLPQIGILFGVAVYLILLLLSATRRLPGVRLWIGLALISMGMALLDFFRGDYVIALAGYRADQVLDVFVGAFAIGMIAVQGRIGIYQKHREQVAQAECKAPT